MTQSPNKPAQDTVTTPYGSVSAPLFDALKGIRLLALDVDGIFSDGRIYLGNAGEEFKAFHTLDGYGVKAVQKLGIKVAVITGRQSNIVEQRMTALGVEYILQGREDKSQALAQLQQQLDITNTLTAAAGDDMPDLGMFEHSGIAFTVATGHPVVRQQADYVCTQPAGFGAVREICDLLLQSREALYQRHGSST